MRDSTSNPARPRKATACRVEIERNGAELRNDAKRAPAGALRAAARWPRPPLMPEPCFMRSATVAGTRSKAPSAPLGFATATCAKFAELRDVARHGIVQSNVAAFHEHIRDGRDRLRRGRQAEDCVVRIGVRFAMSDDRTSLVGRSGRAAPRALTTPRFRRRRSASRGRCARAVPRRGRRPRVWPSAASGQRGGGQAGTETARLPTSAAPSLETTSTSKNPGCRLPGTQPPAHAAPRGSRQSPAPRRSPYALVEPKLSPGISMKRRCRSAPPPSRSAFIRVPPTR